MESALPPTIQMLLAEFSDEDLETRKLHDRFRDSVFVRELKDQAKYSLEKFVYADDKPITNDAFLMYAGGGLNPLGTYGKCSLQECWMDNTLAFSRLAGLYANLTLIPDPLSSWMSRIEPDKRTPNIRRDLVVLRLILPLIEAGVVQLARPTGHFCRVHASEAYSVTEEVAAELWEVFLKDADLSVSQGGKTVYLQVGSPLFGSTDEPFYHVVPLRPDLGKILLRAAKPAARGRLSKSAIHTFAKQIREYVMDEFVKHAAVSLGEAHGAARSGSIVATTSRFENIALRIADKKKVQQVDVEDWEKLRTLRLPWISHLDANEILELREVASKALDPFRLTMRKQLISEKPVQDEDDVAKKVVMELQEAVSIVDSGLRACQSKAKKGFSVLLGSLGLSFVIYGVGSSNFGAASAGAAMMAALTLQHGRDCDAKAEEEKLVSNPGNVLVVARELISHRKHD